MVSVIRIHDSRHMDDVVHALGSAGARIIEITMTVPGAIELISRYADELGDEYLFGCGTVTDRDTAVAAMDAGAAFVVSPVLQEEVVAAATSRGVPAIPAAMSPTEVWRASTIGADAVKLFPARALGPRYVADLLGPLPDLKIVPSGGIGPDNASSFIEAGAHAVFSGSSMVNDSLVERGEFERIKGTARKMLLTVSRARRRNE
jgi:2-dehydro-3-deoxyphosphogluconate aldolase/(4S)-4-hydroxy-2-oxoglutarate aldolase